MGQPSFVLALLLASLRCRFFLFVSAATVDGQKVGLLGELMPPYLQL